MRRLDASVAPSASGRVSRSPRWPPPLISHLDQELHRLVVVKPESGNVYLHDVKSDELKLLAYRNLAADRTAVAQSAPVEQAKLPETDVPGDEVPDVPRPIGARRVGHSIESSDRKSCVTASYLADRPMDEIYGQLVKGLGA